MGESQNVRHSGRGESQKVNLRKNRVGHIRYTTQLKSRRSDIEGESVPSQIYKAQESQAVRHGRGGPTKADVQDRKAEGQTVKAVAGHTIYRRRENARKTDI